MKRAFFIGRFQPFHAGHKAVVLEMLANKEVDYVHIIIGSSQENRTDKNPFMWIERMAIIMESMKDSATYRRDYTIEPLKDINDPPNWVAHVERTVGCHKNDLIYTGNEQIRQLFEEKGYTVITPKSKGVCTATEIREQIKQLKIGDTLDTVRGLDPTGAAYLHRLGAIAIIHRDKSKLVCFRAGTVPAVPQAIKKKMKEAQMKEANG